VKRADECHALPAMFIFLYRLKRLVLIHVNVNVNVNNLLAGSHVAVMI